MENSTKQKRLTIYDIKYRTQETEPYFFDRKTMKFWRQRLSDFHVKKIDDRYYYIYAESKQGNYTHLTERYFDTVTNELLHNLPTN